MTRPQRRGKPSRFTERTREEFVRRMIEGATVKAAAANVGVGERTVHEWRARGRAGEEPFAGWEEQVSQAANAIRYRRRSDRREREEGEARERWKRFKAAQVAYRIDQLGPLLFWRNRLVWLLSHGKTRAYAETVQALRAQNIRVFTPQ